MKALWISLGAIGLVLASALASAAIPGVCARSYMGGVYHCNFYAKKDVTHVYEQPSTSSRIIYTEDWVAHIIVERDKLKTFPKGWLRVEGELAPVGKPRTKYKGWIALDTVVSEQQLKRVKSCWPVSYVVYEAGDYGVKIKFKPDGSYIANPGSKDQNKGHVYYSDGIVVLLGDDGFDAGYDPATRELSDPVFITKQTPFPPEQLQGCGPEPDVTDLPATTSKAKKATKSSKP